MNKIIILAVDPGTTQSGFCLWDGSDVMEVGKLPNNEILCKISELYGVNMLGHDTRFYYEKFAPRGSRLGHSSVDTIEWQGRFIQHAKSLRIEPVGITRQDMFNHYPIIYKSKTFPAPPKRDTQIKSCLTDRFERYLVYKGKAAYWRLIQPNLKISQKKGATDGWQAFALAVMMYDKILDSEADFLE